VRGVSATIKGEDATNLNDSYLLRVRVSVIVRLTMPASRFS